MVRKLVTAAVALGVASLAGPAFADPVTTLSEGVYYGSSVTANSLDNNNWAVASDSTAGLELGLQAVIRYTGAAALGANNTYTVPTGATTVPGETGPAWGYAFSVYNTGSSSYTYLITVSDSEGNIVSFDPAAIGDLGTIDKNGHEIADISKTTNPSTADNPQATGGVGFQDAENLTFPGVGLPGDSIWGADTYTITLTASNVDGVVASDTITVNAVPEPVSMSILGVGLFGMAAARRRAKKARC